MKRWRCFLFGIVVVLAGCSGDSLVVESPGVVSVPPDELALIEPDLVGPTQIPVPTATPSLTEAVLRVAVVGDPMLDPLEASPVEPTDMVVVDLLYDGLTEWDVDASTWAPSLATEFVVSEDGFAWTATLSGATFSNGVPVTAGDVKRSLGRFAGARLTLGATRLEVIEEIVTVDFTTVRFELREPYALLPELLSSPIFGIVPAGELDGAVGSGPLVLEGPGRLRPVDGFDLSFAGVDLVSVENEEAALALRDSGDLDLVYVEVSYEGETEITAAAASEAHFALNVASAKLVDPAVRRAVVGAVSADQIVSEVFGKGAVAIARLTPLESVCGAPCRDSSAPPADLEIGELSIIYVSEESGVEKALADAVSAQLTAAGIASSASGYGLEEFIEQVGSGDYDLVRTGWVGLFPSADSQLAPYSSVSVDSVSAYASEAFDELLSEARAGETGDAYARASQLLVEDAPVLPIARLRVRALVSDAVENLTLRPDGTFGVVKLRVFNPGQ